MEENDELFVISETFALRENAPGFGKVSDIEEYSKIAIECLNSVESSANVREIVLETWLILDYFVRMLLSNLWGLDDFNNEDKNFDLRNELLPGFENCLRLLEKILAIQRSLEEDPKVHSIKLPFGFWYFLKKNYPDFLKRFVEVEEDFYQKNFPALYKQNKEAGLINYTIYSTEQLATNTKKRYCVNKGWVEGTQDLDEEWFKMARKLNNARNKAAHSHDPISISRAFGYSGSNAKEQVKKECLDLINRLVGIVKIPVDKSNRSENTTPGSSVDSSASQA